ncbi:hypothetical protein MRB53_026177 [Persea americana]|uniref:Uncharacterized protein n=1 Tax=Persea americana TaxID=3435 RepID=A0ACC2LHZ1_PERAE|nr:hypothetical protein MRB53_026177 [Persea americana]
MISTCSVTSNSILDRAIDSEESHLNDFLRLEHIEGYHELSAKTKIFFSTAVGKWDAEFYVKVDDDVHVNLGMLVVTLVRHRLKPRVYIGCMKSGPVLAQKHIPRINSYIPNLSDAGQDHQRFLQRDNERNSWAPRQNALGWHVSFLKSLA